MRRLDLVYIHVCVFLYIYAFALDVVEPPVLSRSLTSNSTTSTVMSPTPAKDLRNVRDQAQARKLQQLYVEGSYDFG